MNSEITGRTMIGRNLVGECVGSFAGKDIFCSPYPTHYIEDLNELYLIQEGKVSLSPHNAAKLMLEAANNGLTKLFTEAKEEKKGKK